MIIWDLIKNKDYDYVSYRLTLPDGDDTFVGCFAMDWLLWWKVSGHNLFE